MARKNVLKAYKLASAQALSASFNSSVVNVEYLDNVAITIVCTSVSANTGYFGIQVRSKLDDNNYSDWADLTLSSTPTLSNADANFGISLNQLPWSEFRVKFTKSAGTTDGVCDIWVQAKQVGG